jgi:hypothetical protein
VQSDNDLTQLVQAIELLGRIPFVVDQGIVNNLVVNPVPAVTAYGGSQPKIFAVAVGYSNTAGGVVVNISGLGNVPLTRTTGAPLSANDLTAGGIIIIGENAAGTGFQLLSVPGSLNFPQPQQLWHYGVDVGATNAIVATIDTIGTSWPTGLPVAIKVGHTNTSGTVTVALNGLATVPLTRGSGTVLQNGDIAAGYIALMIFDGTEAQLINILNGLGGGAGGNDLSGPDRPYWLAVNSRTVSSPPGSPNLGDTYVIPIGATGAWAGLDGRLAQWNGTGWVYRAYPAASVVGTSDVMRFYENIGSNVWQEIQMWSLGKAFFYCQL